MSDQGFREIQLSGKQLVFLFMAGVVVAVTVFLLGVSVGRGVKQASAHELEATTEAAPATTAASGPVDMPPPTEMTPADTRYSRLDHPEDAKAAGAGAAASGATPVDEPMPAAASTPADPVPAKTSSTVQGPSAATSAPAPPKEPAVKTARGQTDSDIPKSAPNGQWVVQVNALRSRESAEREVANLKKKGYPAFVLPGGNFYRVRVGPFRERGEADRTATRLTKEGLTPLVTR